MPGTCPSLAAAPIGARLFLQERPRSQGIADEAHPGRRPLRRDDAR